MQFANQENVMETSKCILLISKTFYKAMFLTILISIFSAGGFSSVRAQTSMTAVSAHVISNGQFVYGPNIEGFNLNAYLLDNAPHLVKYADDLYTRSEYFSINPKVYLTLLEVHGNLISVPDVNGGEDIFGLPGPDLVSQVEDISNVLVDAYYLHLYSYSALHPSQRNLPAFTDPDGRTIKVDPATNAGTYAIIAVLAHFENEQRIFQILDNNHPDGFYQTYKKLFGDDPLDEQNKIHVPGEVEILSGPESLHQFDGLIGAGPSSPPDNLLQLPFMQGQTWKFGGVHDNSGGGGVGGPLNDASSMDFYPSDMPWGADTSNMWVAASAPGTPTKISACYFKVAHIDGWETTYYHLENIQNFSGTINQNDKIGVIANTLAEATCNGGNATGPHVHFTLRKNGALVAINGTALSGWYVHAGRWNYDTDPKYMWLERAGIKKYAYSDYLLSEAPPPPSLNNDWVGGVMIESDKNVVVVGRPHIGEEVASYGGFPSGSLTAYMPMLFNGSFGGSYNAAFYVQNVHATNTANITIKYYDSGGALNCTKVDTVAPLASKGYWVPSATCDTGSLPAGWVGGVVVTSDQPIVAVGRPHVGNEVMTYDGFTGGSLGTYLPMLFKGAFGGSYNAAFYVQNVHASNTANITLKYYDNSGILQCTKADTVAALASKGYWVPSVTCDSGSLPAGWVGGVEVTSDQPIVGVGRPHIGTQVTTYNGFTGGSLNSYVPMLFKNAFGGSYDSAFYVQNTHASNTANITIKYYDNTGTLNCTKADTVAPLASKGYWVPSATCDSGSLPAGWVGGVVVTSDQPIVGVGRPHIGAQVTTYNGFTAGSLGTYLPMLFKNAFGGTYNAAFYVQNTEASAAVVTIKFYDSSGNLSCVRSDTIPALSTLGYWVPSVTCDP
jgi:LasA protease